MLLYVYRLCLCNAPHELGFLRGTLASFCHALRRLGDFPCYVVGQNLVMCELSSRTWGRLDSYAIFSK